MNVSKTVSEIVLNFELLVKLWKHLVFAITYICSICQVSMCHPEAYSEPFQTSRMKRFVKIINSYFCKALHFRYLRGWWMRFCYLWHKFSICIFNQVKREHIPINEWRFSLRDSLDEDCVFAGLKKFFLVHKFLSLLLKKFLLSEIIQKLRSIQKITNIIAVADE